MNSLKNFVMILNYHEVEYEKFEKTYKEFKEITPKSDLESYIDFWDNYNASVRLEYLYWNDDNTISRFEKALENTTDIEDSPDSDLKMQENYIKHDI